jgi:hypothetical protein
MGDRRGGDEVGGVVVLDSSDNEEGERGEGDEVGSVGGYPSDIEEGDEKEVMW